MEPVRLDTLFGAVFQGTEARTESTPPRFAHPAEFALPALPAVSADRAELEAALAFFDEPEAERAGYARTADSLQADEPIVSFAMAKHLLGTSSESSTPSASPTPSLTRTPSTSPSLRSSVSPTATTAKRSRESSDIETGVKRRPSSVSSMTSYAECSVRDALDHFYATVVDPSQVVPRAVVAPLSPRVTPPPVIVQRSRSQYSSTRESEFNPKFVDAALTKISDFLDGRMPLSADQQDKFISMITSVAWHPGAFSPQATALYSKIGNALVDRKICGGKISVNDFGEGLSRAASVSVDADTGLAYLQILLRGIKNNVFTEKTLQNDFVRKSLDIFDASRKARQRVDLALQLHEFLNTKRRIIPMTQRALYESGMRKMWSDPDLSPFDRERLAAVFINAVGRKVIVPEPDSIDAAAAIIVSAAGHRLNGGADAHGLVFTETVQSVRHAYETAQQAILRRQAGRSRVPRTA